MWNHGTKPPHHGMIGRHCTWFSGRDNYPQRRGTRPVADVQCYHTVRELRWPDGVVCPSCASKQVIKRGFDDTEPARQRYECHDCHTRFAQIIAVCSSAKPCEIGENLLSVSDLTS